MKLDIRPSCVSDSEYEIRDSFFFSIITDFFPGKLLFSRIDIKSCELADKNLIEKF